MTYEEQCREVLREEHLDHLKAEMNAAGIAGPMREAVYEIVFTCAVQRHAHGAVLSPERRRDAEGALVTIERGVENLRRAIPTDHERLRRERLERDNAPKEWVRAPVSEDPVVRLARVIAAEIALLRRDHHFFMTREDIGAPPPRDPMGGRPPAFWRDEAVRGLRLLGVSATVVKNLLAAAGLTNEK